MSESTNLPFGGARNNPGILPEDIKKLYIRKYSTTLVTYDPLGLGDTHADFAELAFTDVEDLPTEKTAAQLDANWYTVVNGFKSKLSALADWILGRIKNLPTTITAFRTGDVIPVDGPSGTAKMSKDDLLKETAENALAGNVAPAFDATRDVDHPYLADENVVNDGKIYKFKVNHYGAWSNDDVMQVSVAYILDNHETSYGYNDSYIVTLRDGVGIYADVGAGIYKSAPTLTSYIFDVGASNDNPIRFVISDTYTQLRQTDSLPVVGASISGSRLINNSICTARYIIVTVPVAKKSFSLQFTHAFVKKIDDAVGSILADKISTDKLNLFVNASGVYGASSASYNSYIIFVGASVDNPVYFDTSDSKLMYWCETDTYPKSGDTAILHRTSQGYVTGKYITAVIQDTSPASTQFSYRLGLFGVNKNIAKYVGLKPKNFVYKGYAGIFPSTNTFKYVASTPSYNSFVVDIGASVTDPILFHVNDTIFGWTQVNDRPKVGDSCGTIYYGSWGECSSRYLVVSVPTSVTSLDIDIGPSGAFRKKKLKCLFIGNSVTQDHVMYAPYFLKKTYPDIEFKIADFYIGSYTIHQFVTDVITGNVGASIYSVADNSEAWVNNQTGVLLINALKSDDWDLISIQGFYGPNSVENMADVDTFVEWLKTNSNKPFEMAWLSHQTYTAGALAKITQYAEEVFSHQIQVNVPAGYATEFAKSDIATSTLTPDNIHNNEGFPCMMGGYVVGDIIARRLGYESKILGNKVRMTAAQHAQLRIAGQNGTFQEGTESDYAVIQKCAVLALNVGEAIKDKGCSDLLNSL